jgi:RHS repeat-associated protein
LTTACGAVQPASRGGTIATHFKYDSFGNVTSGDTSKTRYLFTSREFDAATKLQYNRARYYDAAVGRWISEDPLGFAAGDANVGRYVSNAATIFNDPNGLEKIIGIHSNVLDPRAGFISGHAWISIHDTVTGETHTYGLYPDGHGAVIDNGDGSDVRVDVEKNLKLAHEQNRYMVLPPEREKIVDDFIKQPAHWRYTHTCAAWASECWQEVTGEDVDADDNFGFETPREISRSIIELEKKDPTGYPAVWPGVMRPGQIPPNNDGSSCDY